MTTLLVITAAYVLAIVAISVLNYMIYKGRVKLLYKVINKVEEVRKTLRDFKP